MRSVTEQLDLVLRAAVTPPPVRTAISEAQGLLCAEEVVASAALPAFDQAAVDGYAVRHVDIAGASAFNPIELPVVGEIRAGSRSAQRLQPNQSVYVATGAPLPTIADTVIPRYETDGHSARVSFNAALPSGSYVMEALTDDLEEAILDLMATVEAKGGAVAAIVSSRLRCARRRRRSPSAIPACAGSP